MWQAGLLCAPDIPPRHNMAPSGISGNTQCPLPTGPCGGPLGQGRDGPVSRLRGVSALPKKKRETEIEAGKKIREEMQRQEIKDKRVREKMRRRREEKWRKKRRTGKGYEKKLCTQEDNRGC